MINWEVFLFNTVKSKTTNLQCFSPCFLEV